MHISAHAPSAKAGVTTRRTKRSADRVSLCIALGGPCAAHQPLKSCRVSVLSTSLRASGSAFWCSGVFCFLVNRTRCAARVVHRGLAVPRAGHYAHRSHVAPNSMSMSLERAARYSPESVVVMAPRKHGLHSVLLSNYRWLDGLATLPCQVRFVTRLPRPSRRTAHGGLSTGLALVCRA